MTTMFHKSVVERFTARDVLRLTKYETVERGGRIWFRCPVHDDEHPSAVVVGGDDGRGWTCHVCKARGGVLDLAQELLKLDSLADAARWLERHA
jgi:hypothetical protein